MIHLCNLSTYWICVLIISFIAMSIILLNALNDYLDNKIVVNFDEIDLNENSYFPAVSVCIEKSTNHRASNARVKHFVQKYYAESNIEEPHQ